MTFDLFPLDSRQWAHIWNSAGRNVQKTKSKKIASITACANEAY